MDSPHEHADLLAPVADDDGCCGEGKGRGHGRGRGEGGCGGGGRGDCADVEAAEAKQTQATA